LKNTGYAIAATALLSSVLASPARADDRAVVESFYTLIVSGGSPDIAGLATKTLAPGWESIGDYSGTIKTREQFVGQLQGFAKLMPDLKWGVQEIIQQGNRYIVRGRASGTPNGPFFGVPASGKSFDVMSIDIHTVESGLIVRSYHVEDWASALRQLAAK
jgi:steroid delta-isomerase-like uncharacterized protein